MKRTILSIFFLSVISLDSMGEPAQVNQPTCQTLLQLEQHWAVIRYQTPEKQRLQSFENELNEIGGSQLVCQQSAEYQLIQAMIKGSMAKLQSRLDGLKMIRQIEKHLQAAIKINPAVMQGMSWTLLGLLYDKSPGWPFSIGDDKAAERAYQKGLALNPDGIDANFYYGDFLRRKKQSKLAREYLLKASRSNQGDQSEIAFQGRKLDVKRALKKLDN